jgi:hypothetical protein
MIDLRNEPYIWDSLYGQIYLPDFIWELIPHPELQRLREVRLCNINSFCLTGGSNINRYEHAIGTCYLAKKCLESWPALAPITKNEYHNFLLAALFHDIASSAFGHTVEYIESRKGFQHEKGFLYVSLGESEGDSYTYKETTLEPIYFGMPRSLLSKLSKSDLIDIGDIINGKGRLGSLLNSTLDLDNIDNVIRFAYHLGLIRAGAGDLAINLAQAFYIQGNQLVFKEENLKFIGEWQRVRRQLYKLLLLNPQEFAGKCMLTEAIDISKSKQIQSFKWYDVDFELLEGLVKVSAETSSIISRLMKGDLYGCIGIYSTDAFEKQAFLFDDAEKAKFEKKIRDQFSGKFKSILIGVHGILDINKTDRQVTILTDKNHSLTLGQRSNELLIGVFAKNSGMSMHQIEKIPEIFDIRKTVLQTLKDEFGDSIREVKLYSETREVTQ